MKRRTSQHSIPDSARNCLIYGECVYRKNGVCDTPRTNKGNSDALCFSENNTFVVANLAPIDRNRRASSVKR